MALVLTRRSGEELRLKLESDISESELQQLMTDGIQIRIAKIDGQQAKLTIQAPLSVSIVRAELLTT
nr:carbon storage regulator [Pseudomonas oleovorans]